MLLKLEFDTQEKKVRVYLGLDAQTRIIYKSFDNVPTVKVREEGYYEVMQKQGSESTSAIPVLRLPIPSTVMEIFN